MRIRTTAVAAVLFAGLSIPMAGTAGAADLNCSDFATQAEAQASFNSTPGDPNNLDSDNDQIACETRPGTSGAQTTTEDSTSFRASQVATRPAGAVAAGDGRSSAPRKARTTTSDGATPPWPRRSSGMSWVVWAKMSVV